MWVRFAAKLTTCHTDTYGDGQHTSGAMEELSRQGQKVSAPKMPDSNTRWCWSALPCPGCRVPDPAVPLGQGRWRNCLGRFKMQALTGWGAKITSTRTTAGQFKCQFKGAMDESSGKGSMMQAHKSSGVVMDIATFKVSHAVGVDIHATALQAKKKERITFHRGDGGNAWAKGSKGKHSAPKMQILP